MFYCDFFYEGLNRMPQLAHHVYFTLKNRSDESIQTLLEACNKYLDNHEGLVGFSLGTRDRELDRDPESPALTEGNRLARPIIVPKRAERRLAAVARRL